MTPKPPLSSGISSLLSKLGFSPDNVVATAANTPLLFKEAIEFRQAALARRNRAKMTYEREYAIHELELRRIAREQDIKITEAAIKSNLLTDADLEKLAKIQDQSDELEEYSKLVVEAVRMQRDCLRIVGDLTRDEIRYADNEKLEALRQNLKAKYPGEE